MEAVLRRLYESRAWKEHAERSMYESIWTGSEYVKHLAERRVVVQEFLQAIGIAPKP